MSRWAFLALAAPALGQLVNFAVTQPPVVPTGVQTCTHQLLERNFANSYYKSVLLCNSSLHSCLTRAPLCSPEIVEYVPATDCGAPGSWSAITLNWTATSNGTQYDRYISNLRTRDHVGMQS